LSETVQISWVYDIVKNMKSIAIRKTKESDAEQHVKLHAKVWRDCYSHIMPKEIFDDNDAKIEERIENFAKRGINKDGFINFVATDSNRIVAFAIGLIESKYDHYRELGYAELMAIYIDPEYQSLGIGRKLFNKITNELKKRNCDKMVIGVLKENQKARKAYEKWGGKLDVFEKPFEKMGYSFPEVFYLYDFENNRVSKN